MAASIDYKELEKQVQDIIRIDSTVVTDWDRSWTNEGRREIQRQHNFPEMLAFYPAKESDIGSVLKTTPAARHVAAPDRFKEFHHEKDGLWYVDGNDESTLLPEKQYDWLVAKYDFNETGEPEYCQIVRLEDGETVQFHLWPMPDAVYNLRCHAYFFVAHFGATEDLTNASDFLLANAPLAVRDAILREAYMALQMRDMSLFAAHGKTVRTDQLISDAKNREMPDGFTLVPSFNARKNPIDEEAGYPWWGKK